jgi:hypothetical protein
LTPPPTDKPSKSSERVSSIIRYLHLRKVGHEPAIRPWVIFQLLSSDFEELITLLKSDEPLWGFFENKIRCGFLIVPAQLPDFANAGGVIDRYDYFSRSGRFVLRMPTTTHEFFRSSVVLEIQSQLEAIAAGTGKAAEFARAVKYRGSPKLQFPADEISEDSGDGGSDGDKIEEKAPSKYDAHEPDAAFAHLDAQWPGIVIEVSFSQKEKELPDLAEDYILGSDGNIRAVIGLNIEYKQSKRATISVWRPQYIEQKDGQGELISEQTVFRQVSLNSRSSCAITEST